MLEALFQVGPDAAQAADAIAPYAPTGVMAIAVWILRGVLAPAKEAAEAIQDYFVGLKAREEAEAAHYEAEAQHWARNEQLLQQVAGQLVLPAEMQH